MPSSSRGSGLHQPGAQMAVAQTGGCGTCSATTVPQLSPRTHGVCACLALQGWRRGSEKVPRSSHDSTAGFFQAFPGLLVLMAGRICPSLWGQPPGLPCQHLLCDRAASHRKHGAPDGWGSLVSWHLNSRCTLASSGHRQILCDGSSGAPQQWGQHKLYQLC